MLKAKKATKVTKAKLVLKARKATKVTKVKPVLKAKKATKATPVLKALKVRKVKQVLQARKAIQLGISSLLVRNLMVPMKTLNKLLRTPTLLRCLQAKI